MLKRSRISLVAIGLFAAQLGMSGHVLAQAPGQSPSGPMAAKSTSDAYAEWYLHQCQQFTGSYRPTCFDLLPARIPGFKGHWTGSVGNLSASTSAPAQSAAVRQFIGTAQMAPARPFAFLEDYNP